MTLNCLIFADRTLSPLVIVLLISFLFSNLFLKELICELSVLAKLSSVAPKAFFGKETLIFGERPLIPLVIVFSRLSNLRFQLICIITLSYIVLIFIENYAYNEDGALFHGLMEGYSPAR